MFYPENRNNCENLEKLFKKQELSLEFLETFDWPHKLSERHQTLLDLSLNLCYVHNVYYVSKNHETTNNSLIEKADSC